MLCCTRPNGFEAQRDQKLLETEQMKNKMLSQSNKETELRER